LLLKPLDFLCRLIRSIPQKVFLIVDKHPVHLSGKLNRWLERHSDKIRLFPLPSYSPELNRDELLNHNVKANAVGRKRAKTKLEMMENASSSTSTEYSATFLSRKTCCLCCTVKCSLFTALVSMKRMVEFAARCHLNFRLAYYPPYHSKYNPIERAWGI
jgi:transposase